MTLKEFMQIEGFKFNSFSWVNVKFGEIEFSIGEDIILGSLSEESIRKLYYPKSIKSISIIDFETVDGNFYFDYQIELY